MLQALQDKYASAVAWIALNDEPTIQDLATVQDQLTVVLVADLFGKDSWHVAIDIVNTRRRMK